MSNPALVPVWISVEDQLPPVHDWLLERSEKLLVATPELGDGIGFAYFRHDDEDSGWVTACSDEWRLEQVSHYANRPSLPVACDRADQ